ncbi:MAG: CBU_0592 family membrane protein [Gemmatimonadota bacterium]
MSYQWHDLVGNTGVATILLTYLLVQIGRLETRTVRYSALNALGAGMVLVSLSIDFNLSAAIVEAAWAGISLYGVWRASRPPLRAS